MKILKLSELLELNDEQTVRFFPRYRKYEDTIFETDRLFRDVMMKISSDEIDLQPEDSIRAAIVQYYQIEEKRIKDLKEFVDSVSDILSLRQQALLVSFEHQFPMRMREVLNEHMEPPFGQGRWGRGNNCP